MLLTGPRPHSEIPNWIAAANVLCLPSHHEGSPNVVLEALASGLPVAAFGGRADVMALVDPRREGFLTLGGTYNGNPLGMAAGLAALRQLTSPVYDELSERVTQTLTARTPANRSAVSRVDSSHCQTRRPVCMSRKW